MSKHPTIELLETLNGALLYAVETATCLAIFYLLYHFLLRKERSFQYNRFYLLATILFSLSFPLINVNYNPDKTPAVLNSLHQVSNEVSKEPIIEPKGYYSVTVVAKSERPLMLWWEAVILIYILTMLALGLRLFVQMKSFNEFIWYNRHNTRFKTDYFLVRTEGKLPTFAFFKYLMWDDSIELTLAEQKQILDHERVHIKQRHSYDIMLMESLKVFFWFNPFIYLYRGLLEETHEYEADYKAVKANDQTTYTKLLVKLVFQKMGLQQGSFFAKNKTLKRVNMIKVQKKVNYLKLLSPIPVAALLFFIFACEAKFEQAPIKVSDVAYVYTNFDTNDTKPVPVNGFKNWKEGITQNLEASKTNLSSSNSGEVVVSFLISLEGQVRDIRIIKGISTDLDKQVVEAIKKSSRWNPGIKAGTATTTRISVPITFSAV
jgi:TonB family protein